LDFFNFKNWVVHRILFLIKSQFLKRFLFLHVVHILGFNQYE
jgi:hypothetical protein